ncbi:inactive pancreatic lipase-related protein 1 isoform X1 [Anabrus simplex]|uniref:inactive pancreatic lipase-related protein 1 isoform X1 n=1 Tax=Anabrus simplex TaxID=316456 RepID=UPI0035A38B21
MLWTHSLFILIFFQTLIGPYTGELVVERVCFFRKLCLLLPYYFPFNVADSIRFLFLNGTTPGDFEVIPLHKSPQLLNNSLFELEKPTVIYMPGYTERYDTESVRTVIQAYLDKGGHNLMIVDAYRALSNPDYLATLKTVPTVARAVAASIDDMVRAGLHTSSIHIIGHSLGGQAAGYVGKYITTGKVHRITALDPAMFFTTGLRRTLRRKVAGTVDIIHTDAGNYGDESSAYTLDFYPNGGRKYQPGCKGARPYCSHQRSWRYYAESVIYEKAFPAVKCDSWNHFKDGTCKKVSNQSVYMGYPCNSHAAGKYYLRTRDEYPFGLGDHTETL